MALLIDLKQPGWLTDQELRVDLLRTMPDVDIRIAEKPGDVADINMLVVSTYHAGDALKYPNLELIQKTGAGVEGILSDLTLPESVRVARLSSDTPGHQIAEYSLVCVLQEQRHFRVYEDQQSRLEWRALAPRQAPETTVAVLGLGRIGRLVAQRFLDNGFQVIGWGRSAKSLQGVECHFGFDQLESVLNKADYVICILPSTAETTGLFNLNRFQSMNSAAVIVNAGRGTLINEPDLIKALDNGLLARAFLDVVQTEPLPFDSPIWLHPKITLTPHVSGWHLGDAILDIDENYRRLVKGEALINLVDRELGY